MKRLISIAALWYAIVEEGYIPTGSVMGGRITIYGTARGRVVVAAQLVSAQVSKVAAERLSDRIRRLTLGR
jgi:hypothetical protein